MQGEYSGPLKCTTMSDLHIHLRDHQMGNFRILVLQMRKNMAGIDECDYRQLLKVEDTYSVVSKCNEGFFL